MREYHKNMHFNDAKPNVNFFWEHVKATYPDARFDFWFNTGELHFYKDGKHETSDKEPWACIWRNGKYEILEEF